MIDPAWQEEEDGQGSMAASLKGIEGCTEASPQGHVGKRDKHWKLSITTYNQGVRSFYCFCINLKQELYIINTEEAYVISK